MNPHFHNLIRANLQSRHSFRSPLSIVMEELFGLKGNENYLLYTLEQLIHRVKQINQEPRQGGWESILRQNGADDEPSLEEQLRNEHLDRLLNHARLIYLADRQHHTYASSELFNLHYPMGGSAAGQILFLSVREWLGFLEDLADFSRSLAISEHRSKSSVFHSLMTHLYSEAEAMESWKVTPWLLGDILGLPFEQEFKDPQVLEKVLDQLLSLNVDPPSTFNPRPTPTHASNDTAATMVNSACNEPTVQRHPFIQGIAEAFKDEEANGYYTFHCGNPLLINGQEIRSFTLMGSRSMMEMLYVFKNICARKGRL